MEYILAEKIKITRPIIFLCGPYYEKNKSSDRRNILRENIHEIYRNEGQDVLPLIVDSFLTKENIDFNEYNVQLLEEICAAVSCQTHIFLDTMSAATELGAFSNSAYSNKICVYVPKRSDVYNQGNVGFFVREAVAKKPGAEIKYMEYRPKIVKKAYSSVFTAEHYAFIGDSIPQNIKKLLEEDARANKIVCDMPITYIESINIPLQFNQICYFERENKLLVNISVKLLFYIVVSVLQQERPDIIDGNIGGLSEDIMEKIYAKVTGAILNSVMFYLGTDKSEYTESIISTIINVKIEELIKHMIMFTLVYYTKSQFRKMHLINESIYTAIQTEIGNHPKIIFKLSNEQMRLVKQINKNPDIYFERFKIYSRRKERELVRYSETEEGRRAKNLHQEMNAMFRKEYTHSKYSYAYHKECSIGKCIECHRKSKSFLKLDIKKFFKSISKAQVLKKIEKDWKIDKHYVMILDQILSCCFYEEKLPLGLVMSPMISDYFLREFDIKVGKYCKANRLIYTRYADDIMISSDTSMDETRKNSIENYVVVLLQELDLQLNYEKGICVNFDENHSFIRYIGINIVKGDGNNTNYLSVGKKYIYDLAKAYIEYDQAKEELANCSEERKKGIEAQLFYKRAELIGKIGFVKQIEGKRGIERLQTRLSKYYPDVDLAAL